jgi:signal transduction histidine kinase
VSSTAGSLVTVPALTPGGTPDPPADRFVDELIRPFLTITTVVVTAVQFRTYPIIDRPLALGVFVAVAVAAISTLFPWGRVPRWLQVAVMGAYAVLAGVLLALAQATMAPVFVFAASAVAGAKLASRRAAIGVAVAGALSCGFAVWIVGEVDPAAGGWPWWFALTVVLPVYLGISRRDRTNALFSARQATAAAQRAVESEAREGALAERARIAREIHDVLGHSLSGIAMQLDLADALQGSGRGEEAAIAVRRARALAVESISETRRAVHALREDTLPLQETLRLMADGAVASFEVRGEAGSVRVETAHTVIRTAQESLTNAVKHAPGAIRTMTLTFHEDTVSLLVTNGPGQAPRPSETTAGSGMGLVGMRERAALLGGTLQAGPDLQASMAGGWRVELEVPR